MTEFIQLKVPLWLFFIVIVIGILTLYTFRMTASNTKDIINEGLHKKRNIRDHYELSDGPFLICPSVRKRNRFKRAHNNKLKFEFHCLRFAILQGWEKAKLVLNVDTQLLVHTE